MEYKPRIRFRAGLWEVGPRPYRWDSLIQLRYARALQFAYRLNRAIIEARSCH